MLYVKILRSDHFENFLSNILLRNILGCIRNQDFVFVAEIPLPLLGVLRWQLDIRRCISHIERSLYELSIGGQKNAHSEEEEATMKLGVLWVLAKILHDFSNEFSNSRRILGIWHQSKGSWDSRQRPKKWKQLLQIRQKISSKQISEEQSPIIEYWNGELYHFMNTHSSAHPLSQM